MENSRETQGLKAMQETPGQEEPLVSPVAVQPFSMIQTKGAAIADLWSSPPPSHIGLPRFVPTVQTSRVERLGIRLPVS